MTKSGKTKPAQLIGGQPILAPIQCTAGVKRWMHHCMGPICASSSVLSIFPDNVTRLRRENTQTGTDGESKVRIVTVGAVAHEKLS